MGASQPISLTAWVDDWIRVVGDRRGPVRDAAICDFVAEDAQVVAPDRTIVGRAAYVRHMDALLDAMGPGARFERSGPVDAHHGWLLFGWRTAGADPGWEGATEGIDVVQLDAAGRMKRNIVFVGARPAAADPG